MSATIYSQPYRHLVAKLRDARRRRRLTQTEAARAVKKARTWVSKVELCEIKPDVLHLVRLCRAYGLDAHRLVKEMEEELSGEGGSFFYPLEQRVFVAESGVAVIGKETATPLHFLAVRSLIAARSLTDRDDAADARCVSVNGQRR